MFVMGIRKTAAFFVSALVVIVLSSCTTAYIPTEVNAPGFSNSNQFKGGIGYGTSGANLQLAYSFTKNFGAIGDFSYLKVRGNEPRFQRQWGLGLGYFSRVSKKDSIYFEVFAGFSKATTSSSYEETEYSYGIGYENADYYRVYVQPDFSLQNEFVDLIFALRINYFNFTKYEYFETANNQTVNTELPSAFGFEPVIKVRLGSEYLKLKYQLGYSFIQTLDNKFNHEKYFTAVGLEFSF
jgi:hypothetical protein